MEVIVAPELQPGVGRDGSPIPPSIGVQIRHLEVALAALRQQQKIDLVATIAAAVGSRVVFSAGDLWRHRVVSLELAAAFTDAGITNARQLGKRLQQLRGSGIERVDEDSHGAIWVVG